MKSLCQTAVKVGTALLFGALCAMPQTYTISARPGVINYIEGSASINGAPISAKTTGKTFLNAGDTLSTGVGKAEVLLTPGVFLRVGADSEIRMISPSLTKTSIEVTQGEAYIEAAELTKENDLEVVDHGATVILRKPGLYRFTATGEPVVAVISGKADVEMQSRSVSLGKDHQLVLDAQLKPEKFDARRQDNSDDLYAWSKVRDQYEAASSFATAKSIQANSSFGSGYGYGGYGYGGYGYGFNGYAPGWAYNGMWNSWAWLPGDGAFFSPFGYGFFSPGVVLYAPITYVAVGGRPVAVPVNPSHPPTVGTTTGSTAGIRPTRTPLYTTSGMAYRGNVSPIGSSSSGHVSSRSIAASAANTSAARSGGSSGSYGGAPTAYSAPSNSAGPASSARSSGASMGHSSGGGSRR